MEQLTEQAKMACALVKHARMHPSAAARAAGLKQPRPGIRLAFEIPAPREPGILDQMAATTAAEAKRQRKLAKRAKGKA